jgi:hypothetical protein
VAEHHVRNLGKPDEIIEFPRVKVRVVDLGDITVGHFVHEPGWSWRECVARAWAASGARRGTSG